MIGVSNTPMRGVFAPGVSFDELGAVLSSRSRFLFVGVMVKRGKGRGIGLLGMEWRQCHGSGFFVCVCTFRLNPVL